jgi:hypothetical protein
MNNLGGGLETDALEGGAVAKILRLQVVGLLEKAVGGFVVLAGFRILTFGVEVFRFIGEEREGEGGDQRQQKGRAQ